MTDRTALQRIADRMRQIGMSRILYGSDGPETEAKAPREAWALFRSALPLTDAEVRAIAANLAPYLQVTQRLTYAPVHGSQTLRCTPSDDSMRGC